MSELSATHFIAPTGLGEGEDELKAAGGAETDGDLALMEEDGVLDDGEAEACAAHLAGATLVDAIESLEKMRNMLGSDAGAVVGETECVGFRVLCKHLDGDGHALSSVGY